MSKYAVTGVSEFTHETEYRKRTPDTTAAISIIIRSFMALTDVDEVTTGAAHCADTEAFYAGLSCFPKAHHRVIVPVDCDYNHEVISVARRKGCEIIEVHGESPQGYMWRNDLLVVPRHCDTLLAYPWTIEEEKRSGTWSTVRRARKQNREIRIHPLREKLPDGSTRRIGPNGG